MNNLRFREFYRRRLPHIQIPGATYFVTFRLANSLPKEVLESLSRELQEMKLMTPEKAFLAHRNWFSRYDNFLDRAITGDNFLQNPQVADLVAETIHYRDGKVYDLIAFSVMPNHAHVVFTPLEKDSIQVYSLTEILHSLKRNSAKQANKILDRTGAFWQDESYDHFIRDETELERIVAYVLHNPVKAGLAAEWVDWKWSYSKYEM